VPKETEADKDYIWYEMGFFTYWDHSGRCRVVCIDTPEELQSELETVLQKQWGLETALQKQSPPLNFSDPFTMHVPLIDQIILQYDDSVWGIRDLIRKIEKVSTSIMLPEGIVDKYRVGKTRELPRRREQTRLRTRFFRNARDL
jgi:hypothetical protein